MILDEMTSRSHIGTHENIEEGIGHAVVPDSYLLECALVGIQSSLPKLGSAHFSQALVSLKVDAPWGPRMVFLPGQQFLFALKVDKASTYLGPE